MGILAAVRERLQPEAAGGNHFEAPRKPDGTAWICRSGVLPAGIHMMDAIGHGCMHGPSCRCRASSCLPTPTGRNNNQHAWLAMETFTVQRHRLGGRCHHLVCRTIRGIARRTAARIDRELQSAPRQGTEAIAIDDQHAGCTHSDRLLGAPQPVACTDIHLKPSGIRPARARAPCKMSVPHRREGTITVAHEERATGKVALSIFTLPTKLTRASIWIISPMSATPSMADGMLQARNRAKSASIRMHAISDPRDVAWTAALVRSIMLRGNPLRQEHQHCVGRNGMRSGRRIRRDGAQDCRMSLERRMPRLRSMLPAEHHLAVLPSISRLVRRARP